jgi:hypothetical protein
MVVDQKIGLLLVGFTSASPSPKAKEISVLFALGI